MTPTAPRCAFLLAVMFALLANVLLSWQHFQLHSVLQSLQEEIAMFSNKQAVVSQDNAEVAVKTNKLKTKSVQESPCASNTLPFAIKYPCFCTESDAILMISLKNNFDIPSVIEYAPNLFGLVSSHGEGDVIVPIPPSIAQLAHTLTFWASINTFSGTIPSEVFTLTQLKLLSLSQNALTGTLSSQIGRLSRLSVLTLFANELKGTLPSELGVLTKLVYLYVGENNFSGQLPSQLGLLTRVVDLSLGFLPRISSTIPSQLGELASLTSFYVQSSGLHGTLPSQLGRLTNLLYFKLQNTTLAGTIPKQMLTLSKLTLLNINSARISGEFDLMARLTQLVMLNVDHNQMTGTISSQFGRCSNLKYLSMRSNQLSGTIPSQLLLLTQLINFDVTQNNFHGYLPSEWTAPTQLPHAPQTQPPTQTQTQTQTPPPTQPPTQTQTQTQTQTPRRTTPLKISCSESGLLDSQCQIPVNHDHISTLLFCIVCALAGIAMCVVIALMVFVLKNKNHPCIRASSPMFSVTTLVGLGLLVLAVPSVAVSVWGEEDSRKSVVACRVAISVLGLGAVVVMACVLVRSFVMWRIFFNPNANLLAQKPHVTFQAFAALVAMNIALEIPVVLNIEVGNSHCFYSHDPAARAVRAAYFIYLGAVAIATVIMSLKIRDVPSQFNETTHIARATYNLLTFGVGVVLVGFLTRRNTARIAAITFTVLLCVGSFIVFVYLPKISAVRYESTHAATVAISASIHAFRKSRL